MIFHLPSAIAIWAATSPAGFARHYTILILVALGEIGRRGKSHLIGNLANGEFGAGEQLLGTGQTVSAKLAGSGSFGPMAWTGRNPREALLREIPVHVEAAPGDTVLSSGYSTIYPPDIPLGVIVSSKVSQGASQDITVTLFEDFRSLNSVYIVKNNRREELEELHEQAQ